jgi:hypothetical protein
MINLNTLYVCPQYFTLKGSGHECNVIPFGAIININTEDTNIRLYNAEILTIIVDDKHPDLEPVHDELQVASDEAFTYNSYENQQDPDFNPTTLRELEMKNSRALGRYKRRQIVVCRRETRNLIKQLDIYLSKVNDIK